MKKVSPEGNRWWLESGKILTGLMEGVQLLVKTREQLAETGLRARQGENWTLFPLFLSDDSVSSLGQFPHIDL